MFLYTIYTNEIKFKPIDSACVDSDDVTNTDVIPIFLRHVTNVFRKMASDNVNEQRVVIKFYTLLGKSFSDIREDLHTVYGDSCISKSAISKWMNRFKEGRDTTKSDKRKGRPVTVSIERKVAEIQEYILEDRRVIVKMLRNTLVFRMVQLRILCLTS